MPLTIGQNRLNLFCDKSTSTRIYRYDPQARLFTIVRRPVDEEIDWDAVYTEILPRIYNFFRYRVNDQATAEDLTAATLERAWQGVVVTSISSVAFQPGFSGSPGTSPPTIFATASELFHLNRS